jgi:hypothetical protein
MLHLCLLSPIGILVASAATASAVPHAGLSELNWLSGNWKSETEQGWTEEYWTADRGGLMLGLNRSGKGGKASGFEYMRLQRDGSGRIVLWASPGGKAAVGFPQVTDGGRQRIVFENPANDYPQRIIYQRRGDRLTGTISDMKGGKAYSWTFKRED